MAGVVADAVDEHLDALDARLRNQILELLVKVVNGCSLNGAYWFFYGSTSNVALHYTVEDLHACKSKTVDVPLGQFASNGDVAFFSQSCP